MCIRDSTLVVQCKNRKWSGLIRPKAHFISDTSIQFFFRGINYFIQNGSLTHCEKQSYGYSDILSLEKGEILTCELNNQGVKHFASLSDLINNTSTTYLPDVSATGIIIDRSGNYWISTQDQGIFFLNKLKVIKINKKTANDILCIDDKFFLIENKRQLIEYDKSFNQKFMYDFGTEIVSLTHYTPDSLLIICGSPNLILDYKNRKLIKRPEFVANGILNSSTGARINTDTSILLWRFNRVHTLNNLSSIAEPIILNSTSNRITTAIQESDTTYLIGTTEGVIRASANSKELLNNHKNNPLRINQIINIDSSYLFSSTGKGISFFNKDSILYLSLIHI